MRDDFFSDTEKNWIDPHMHSGSVRTQTMWTSSSSPPKSTGLTFVDNDSWESMGYAVMLGKRPVRLRSRHPERDSFEKLLTATRVVLSSACLSQTRYCVTWLQGGKYLQIFSSAAYLLIQTVWRMPSLYGKEKKNLLGDVDQTDKTGST